MRSNIWEAETCRYFSIAAKKRLELTFSCSCSSVWRNHYRHWSDQSKFDVYTHTHVATSQCTSNLWGFSFVCQICVYKLLLHNSATQAFCWEHNWIEFPCLRVYLVWVHMRVRVCARVLIHIWADVQGAVSCLTMRWLRTLEISVPKERERSCDQHFWYKRCEWLRINQPEDVTFSLFFQRFRVLK